MNHEQVMGTVNEALKEVKREGQRLGAIKFALWLRRRNLDVLTASQEDIIAWAELIPDYQPH